MTQLETKQPEAATVEAPQPIKDFDRLIQGHFGEMKSLEELAGEIEPARKIATEYAASGIYGTATVAELTVKIMIGRELHIPTNQAIKHIYVIRTKDGRVQVTMSAELMRSLASRVPGMRWRYDRNDNEACVITASRPGWEPVTVTYGPAEARLAGSLGNATYQKYPAAMFIARCSSLIFRMMFMDTGAGIGYTPDDFDDAQAVALPTAQEVAAKLAERFQAPVASPVDAAKDGRRKAFKIAVQALVDRDQPGFPLSDPDMIALWRAAVKLAGVKDEMEVVKWTQDHGHLTATNTSTGPALTLEAKP